MRGHDKRRVPAFLSERLEAGEQIYWVCPRIGDGEGNSKSTLASAERRYEQLARSKLASFGLELVHGRVAADERALRLDRFRRGEVGLLVATTVIEVGVDVPSATVMVIENAERLGLAQLHQLRGRVGRGPAESWCLLYGKQSAADASNCSKPAATALNWPNATSSDVAWAISLVYASRARTWRD